MDRKAWYRNRRYAAEAPPQYNVTCVYAIGSVKEHIARKATYDRHVSISFNNDAKFNARRSVTRP